MHRFVLAEMNTHRVFSRNSASSRAIPINKQIERVANDLAYPVEWGLNQAGMQASELASFEDAQKAREVWSNASQDAIYHVQQLQNIGTDSEGKLRGIHKQVANRLLEPFMWHQVIISSVDWINFFSQRLSPLAQPEMRVVSEAINEAIENSTPKQLNYGQWHTPYIQDDEDLPENLSIAVSAARCARVSYLTHSGNRDIVEDTELYKKLTTASPPHWSPLEHIATPWSPAVIKGVGNFKGWHQLRHYGTEEIKL